MSMIFTLTSHLHGPTHTGSTTCIVRLAITAGIGEARGIHLILSMAAGDTIHGDIIHGDITHGDITHGTAHSTAVGDTRTMDITDITITAGDTLTTATAITGEVDTTVLFTKIAITQCLTPPTEG